MNAALNREHSNIEIEVSNFGPVEEAEIELRPLTIFVGPSNTGKSYLAILIYALHRFFSGGIHEVGGLSARSVPFAYSPFLPLSLLHKGSLEKSQLSTLYNWIKGLEESESVTAPFLELPEDVADIIRPLMQSNERWDEQMLTELTRCFGREDAAWLIRNGFEPGARFAVKKREEANTASAPSLRYDFHLTHSGLTVDSSIASETVLKLDQRLAENLQAPSFLQAFQWEAEKREALNWSVLLSELTDGVGKTMFSPLGQVAYYLPADRAGVVHAQKVIAASLISAASLAGLRTDSPMPKLSGVLSDFLVQLLSLSPDEPRDSGGAVSRFSDTIEKLILAGEIQIDGSDAGHPVLNYKPKGWTRPIPLVNSSSMVSELAPIVLYLRSVVDHGDVLIIEEPESHLHPEMQVELIRQLATVVNAGVRIIVTTHSEWVLEELANLVHLSDLEEGRRTASMKDIPVLQRADVGVWLFERQKDGNSSRVTEVPLNTEEGGYDSGYSQTAQDTYNLWANIQNAMPTG